MRQGFKLSDLHLPVTVIYPEAPPGVLPINGLRTYHPASATFQATRIIKVYFSVFYGIKISRAGK